MFDANRIKVDNWRPMLRVRKLPVIVHATQINLPEGFFVDTPEGRHTGAPGDYLLIGVRGEKCPVGKDIFEETYEILSPVGE